MKTFFIFCFIVFFYKASSQAAVDTVSIDSLRSHINYLASDKLEGRGAFSRGLMTSAEFIYDKFKTAGLKAFPGFDAYFQPFGMYDPNQPMKDSNGYRYDNCLLNVVGILEGKTKPDEVIIISAHYDHVGIEDEIHNGANDNASGVAALLALLDYYSRTGTNERSIMFCAFSGEELGLHGSTAFVRFIRPESIVAMINMDMVGVPEVGKKKFFITGEDYSGLKKIMKQNLEKHYFKIGKETPGRNLFERSDNYPFAKLQIPAHTIMTADDVSFRCYHKPCDDVGKIDYNNLGGLVKALIRSLHTIVSGDDTPARIKKKFY